MDTVIKATFTSLSLTAMVAHRLAASSDVNKDKGVDQPETDKGSDQPETGKDPDQSETDKDPTVTDKDPTVTNKGSE